MGLGNNQGGVFSATACFDLGEALEADILTIFQKILDLVILPFLGARNMPIHSLFHNLRFGSQAIAAAEKPGH